MGIPKGKETVGFLPLRPASRFLRTGRAPRTPAPFRDPIGPCAHGLYSPGIPACLSPRFYPQFARARSPLLDGVPRFGGALLSLRRSRWTKTQIAVCPLATVMLHFDASQCPPGSLGDLRGLDSASPRNPVLLLPFPAAAGGAAVCPHPRRSVPGPGLCFFPQPVSSQFQVDCRIQGRLRISGPCRLLSRCRRLVAIPQRLVNFSTHP